MYIIVYMQYTVLKFTVVEGGINRRFSVVLASWGHFQRFGQ